MKDQGSQNKNSELKIFLDSLPHNAAVIDAGGKIICVNESWNNFASKNNLSPEECGSGINYLEVLSESEEEKKEVKKALRGIKSVIAGDKRKFVQEYSCHSPDERRWFKMRAIPFRQGALVMHENIKERKSAGIELKEQKEELKRKNQSLEVLFSGSGSAIARLDEEHRVIDINDKFKEIFGYELEEIKGQDMDEVLEKGKSGSAGRNLTEKVLEGQKVVDQGTRYDFEGNPHEFIIKGIPIKIEGNLEGIYAIYEEITELRRRKRELRRSRKKLRITLNSIGDAVIATDTGGKITRMNPRAEKLTGWFSDEARGKNLPEVFEIVSAETGEPVPSPVKEVMESGGKVGLANHTKLISRDGREYQIADSASPIRDEEGEIQGAVLVFRDVTEKYHMRRELEKSEERLQKTLSVIPEMVSIHDLEMNILYSNWKGIGDVPPERRQLDEKCYRVYREREDICPDCEAKEVLETGESLQKETSLPEGGWIDLRVLPVKDETGEIEYLVEWVRDITERKNREERIKKQNERLASIIEGTNVGTWEWNVQTGEQIINEKWAEMLGYSREELEPVTIDTWRELMHPEDLKRAQKKLEKHFRGEKEQYHIENRLQHKDGSWVWVLNRGRVFTWTEDGSPEWMYGTHLDITSRKKKQRKIEHMSRHDELTGLHNRNYLEEKIKELDSVSKLPVSIIMLDVNGLKLVNDTYGHKIGDRLLDKTADIIQECTREQDFAARWAGDEFVILLPHTGKKEARKICDRIEARAEKNRIADDIPLTLGVGLSVKTRFEEDIYEILHEAEDNMQKDKLTRSRSGKNKLVQNLLNTLAAKSDETREHALRMTKYAHSLGEEFGLTNGQLNNLSLLATLHDIGKVTISEDILKKPGGLSDEEWEIIKQHPERGYVIASASEEFAPIAREILYHHERWDGGGYPEGIAGEEIPLRSRIIAIVDAYDVMTNGRPYKEPMSREEALQEIKQCAGEQFDPKLAKKFAELME